MKELGSCVGPISGEHIISDSVIRILMADGDFSVSGLPWLEDGKERILAPKNLTANCLCTRHNSALHRLDDAAKYFFASLKAYLELDTGTKHALVSGHDIERWLLKTAKAAAVSKNLAREKERLSGVFSQDKVLLDMLDSPAHWQDWSRPLLHHENGRFGDQSSTFPVPAAYKRRRRYRGLALNILGLSFVLLLEPLDLAKYPFLRGAINTQSESTTDSNHNSFIGSAP